MLIIYADNTYIIIYHYNTLCVHLYKNIKEKTTLPQTLVLLTYCIIIVLHP